MPMNPRLEPKMNSPSPKKVAVIHHHEGTAEMLEFAAEYVGFKAITPGWEMSGINSSIRRGNTVQELVQFIKNEKPSVVFLGIKPINPMIRENVEWELLHVLLEAEFAQNMLIIVTSTNPKTLETENIKSRISTLTEPFEIDEVLKVLDEKLSVRGEKEY